MDLTRETSGGHFVRQQSAFREHVTERPRPGRYHLYVSLACPWASRVLVVRALKGLEELLPVTVVDPIRDEAGWRFTAEEPDPVNGFLFLSQAYEATDPTFDGRVTVPVLWDKETSRVVNNESADLVRMLARWSDDGPDLYPEDLAREIDEVNDWVYSDVNNGVYRCGFARTQAAYEEAFVTLWSAMDRLEERLGERRYLVDDTRITEADWRLFVTLVRFDAVYVSHFKTGRHRVADLPNLRGYLQELYQHPGIRETVDFDHIKTHYFGTHPQLNPTRIVPVGPDLSYLDEPHGRGEVLPRNPVSCG